MSTTTGLNAQASPRPATEERAFFEFEVERTVSVTSGAAAPLYPLALKGEGREGDVVARFIVSQNGEVDAKSFKVLMTAHPLFAEAVRVAVVATKYRPAERLGHPVRQVVQQRFHFEPPK